LGLPFLGPCCLGQMSLGGDVTSISVRAEFPLGGLHALSLLGSQHGCRHRFPSFSSLHTQILKYDILTKSSLKWSEESCWPAEPLFVPTPGAKDEDDGKSGRREEPMDHTYPSNRGTTQGHPMVGCLMRRPHSILMLSVRSRAPTTRFCNPLGSPELPAIPSQWVWLYCSHF
jgi:hypothetical protein